MEMNLDDARTLLARTPAVLAELLQGLPAEWLDCREGPETFSPVDVLGHLIYGEQVDWIPRMRMILEHGESRPFDPFDRVGFQNLIQGKDLEELLKMFKTLRNQSLQSMSALNLHNTMLDRTGIHPAFGRVTLGQLISTWVVHDLGHLAQIERVMARQYREAVGPWRAFLPILDVPHGNS